MPDLSNRPYGTVIARRYRDGRRLLRKLCAARRVCIGDIERGSRSAHIVRVKREFCEISKAHGIGSVIAGFLLRIDPSTVSYHRSAGIRAAKKARR